MIMVDIVKYINIEKMQKNKKIKHMMRTTIALECCIFPKEFKATSTPLVFHILKKLIYTKI